MEERRKNQQRKANWDDVCRKWAQAGMYVLFFFFDTPSNISWKEKNVSRKAKEMCCSFPLQVGDYIRVYTFPSYTYYSSFSSSAVPSPLCSIHDLHDLHDLYDLHDLHDLHDVHNLTMFDYSDLRLFVMSQKYTILRSYVL